MAGLVLALLLAPVLALMSSTAAHAVDTLCLPDATHGCLAGTLRTEDGVLPDVTITVTDEAGAAQEVVTSETGKWNLRVDKEGPYTVKIDESTLPKDLVTDGEVKVTSKFGVTIPALITIRTENYSATTSKFDELLQSSVNGLRLGLLLALASVGLSLIYGTTGLSNFAHAEQVTLGGMLGYYLINVHGLGLWVGGVLVVILCAFSGWLQDRVLWQPLRRRGLGLTQLMIVTIGLSLALQYVYQYTVGARTVRVVQDNPEVSEFGPITITNQSIVAMVISVVVLAAVGYALLRTRIGRATRAVSDNPALAAASGIDTDKVIRLVWTVAMGLAGLSGILYALVTNGIKWDTGLQILLLLFAAVTLGGLGTAFGALVGALIIGLVVELSPVLGMPGDFKYATALLILILLLLVRPQGLLGKPQRIG
ncbi:branched-chain amino acid ABC transporter permease [Nocardioides mangrovi]|uniref:Branched-chain amino acid ABC transporter permease n=1 Tax=Nocardioides mangrovi TaxID=2874580 RepID=A0ABS7U7R8_9ACTN|nr:branched-chain amino acid ABC transporter permease [Nocardioides mangrovi]MBZ5736862.1 branched-chain amino acid ABC transporter permease [Nocardioides mangrovi]